MSFATKSLTGPLVIEALRLFARIHVGSPRNTRSNDADWRGRAYREDRRDCDLVMIGHAAFLYEH